MRTRIEGVTAEAGNKLSDASRLGLPYGAYQSIVIAWGYLVRHMSGNNTVNLPEMVIWDAMWISKAHDDNRL